MPRARMYAYQPNAAPVGYSPDLELRERKLVAQAVIVPSLLGVTAAYAVSGKDASALLLADATGGAVTVTLPAAKSVPGMRISLKKSDASANAVTFAANGAELIDGAGTLALAAQYDYATIQSDGVSAWWVI